MWRMEGLVISIALSQVHGFFRIMTYHGCGVAYSQYTQSDLCTFITVLPCIPDKLLT